MKYRFIILVAILIALWLLIAPSPAKAQSSFDHLWSFDADSNPYTLTHGATVGFHAGISRTADDLVVWDEDRNHLGFDVSVPSGTITSLTWIEAYVDYFGLYRNWNVTITPSVGDPTILSWSDTIGSPHTWVEDLTTPVDCSGGGCIISWVGNTSHSGADYAVLEFSVSVEAAFDPWGGAPGPYQPVRESDRLTITPITHPPSSLEYDFIKLSAPAVIGVPRDVPVFATHIGTVASVTPNGDTYTVAVDTDPAYGDATIITYINLSDVYVEEGDSITGGCVLGLAGQYAGEGGPTPDLRSIEFQAYDTDTTSVIGPDTWTTWADPTSETHCGSASINRLYQPVRMDLQVQNFTPRDESGTILTASRITAKQDQQIDEFMDPHVYSPFAGTILSVVQSGSAYALTMSGTVDGASLTATFSNLSSIYVKKGDSVGSGCVLGEMGPRLTSMSSIDPTGSLHLDENLLDQIYFGVAGTDGHLLDWSTWADPSGNKICGSAFTSADCLVNDPNFISGASMWRNEGAPGTYANTSFVHFAPRSVTLDPQAAISQDVVLPNTADTFQVTIAASVEGATSAPLHVSLGDASEDITISNNLSESQVVATGTLDPTIPDLGTDVYTLRIQNGSTNAWSPQIVLNFVCLHDSGSPPLVAPPKCYFNDQGYVFASDPWTFTGGGEFGSYSDLITSLIPFLPNASGTLTTLHLPLDSTASRPVQINAYPDRDTVFLIDVYARKGPNLLPANTANLTASLEDEGGTVDSHTFEVSNSITIAKQEAELTLASGTVFNGNLVLASSAGAGSGGDYVALTGVCLSPKDGTWPGFENAAQPPSLFPSQTCTLPDTPTDFTDVWAWLQWLGAGVGYSTCQVMNKLGDILDGIFHVSWWLGMFARWLNDLSNRAWVWASDFFGTYIPTFVMLLLQNLMLGLLSGILHLRAIQALYDKFSIGNVVLGFVITELESVFGLLNTALHAYASMIHIAQVFGITLRQAFNGSTTATTGLPNCGDYTGSEPLYPMCLGLDLMDYVVIKFPSMGILTIVASGIVAAITGEYIVTNVGQALGDVD